MRNLIVVLALAPAAPLAAQQSGFVVRLGSDTIAVEQVTRTAARIAGELVVRSPRVQHRRYAVDLRADGSAERAELTVLTPGTATPLVRAVARFTGDSAIVDVERGERREVVRLALPRDVVPMVEGSWAMHDVMIARARGARGDSLRLTLYEIGASARSWIDVVRLGRDSLRFVDENLTHRALVSGAGALLGAARPEQQFTVERHASADVAAVAAAWADAERRRGAMGILSPRDSLRTTVAGATITIDYSRPSRRGRVIFGRVVPWNEVWRTGANQATRFTTDRALDFGGVVVPAGSYSMLTVPGPTAWRLVLNAPGANAGAAYDPARDLFHLPMTVTSLPRSVEQLTITVTQEGGAGRLRIQWDTVEAAITFGVR